MFKYLLFETDEAEGTSTDIGVFNTKEEAEGAAHQLLESYDGEDIKNKTIDVARISKNDLKDKDDWLSYTKLEIVMSII